MSDYYFETTVLRGAMAAKLAANDDQFVHVLTNALSYIDIDEAISLGQVGDDAKPRDVVDKLRKLADAIEAGQVS